MEAPGKGARGRRLLRPLSGRTLGGGGRPAPGGHLDRGGAMAVPASSTILRMPRSASCRSPRYSSKSEVTNQHTTSTSSAEGENAASFETTTSGQTFGIPRSSRSIPSTTWRTCFLVVPWTRPTVVAKRMRSREAKSPIRMSASLPFGRLMSVRSVVRMCVERMPIRSTLPVKSSTYAVAHAEGLVGGEGDRAEEVLDRLLGAEGQGEAADAEAGEDGGHGVAEGGEGGHHASIPTNSFTRSRVADRSERAEGLAAAQGLSMRDWAHTSTERHRAQKTAIVAVPAVGATGWSAVLGQQGEPAQEHGGHGHPPQEGERR